MIELMFVDVADTDYFREYTYVYLNGDINKKTMIWKIVDGKIYIGIPVAWTNSIPDNAISQISNIDGLYNISTILQEVYVNVEYDWYIPTKDNIRRRICAMYAQLLSENVEFRVNVTGLLTQNDDDEFILKLYDFENDEQFSFSTIELMYLGADRKTRMPVPIKSESLRSKNVTYTTDWNILDDGLISGTIEDNLSTNTTDEVFDFGLDVVLGGPNDPPMLFTLVDGNDPTL
jgi:hypothetical protein